MSAQLDLFGMCPRENAQILRQVDCARAAALADELESIMTPRERITHIDHSARTGLDALRDNPRARAEQWRIDARTQLNNPYVSPAMRQRLHDERMAEAERIEAQGVQS